MKDSKLPQLIILGVLVAVCLGYLTFRLSGIQTQAAAPLEEQSVTMRPSTQAQSEPAVKPSQEAIPAIEEVALQMAYAATKKDPFVPVFIGQTGAPVVVASAPSPPKLSTTTLPPFSFPMDLSLAPLGGEDEELYEKEHLPVFRLTGIIRGNQNLAIIRSGDKGRHIVREGQYIEGRYKVVAIREASVIIQFDSYREEIKLGGRTNAS